MIELRRALPFLAIACLLFVAGCSQLLERPPTPAPPAAVAPVQPLGPGRIGPGDLEAQRAVWAGKGVADYTWEVAFGCECMLNGVTTVKVKDGAAVEAVNNGNAVNLADIEGFPLTLDAVFAEAQATIQGGGTVNAEWDANGLPKQLNLDRDLQAIDDELGISIISVTPTE